MPVAAAYAALDNKADFTNALEGQVSSIVTNGGRTFVAGNFLESGIASGAGTQWDLVTGAWAGSGIATAADETGNGPVVSAVVSDGAGGWYVGGFFENEIAGSFSQVRHNLMHINPDGSPDTTFDAGLDGPVVLSLAYDTGTNTLYVGGQFTQAGGAAHTDLAAVDGTTGTARAAFNPGVTGGNGVVALALSGTTLYAGGSFTNIGASGPRVAAMDKASATINAGFAPTPTTGAVLAITATGGRVYLGGDFASLNGVANTANLAATDTAGAVQAGYTPKPNGNVTALATDGTNIYTGGSFTQLDTTGAVGLGSVGRNDPGAANAFPATDGTVETLDFSAGFLYVGGTFGQIGGAAHANLGRIDLAGPSVDATTWRAGNTVHALATDADSIYAGGTFHTVQGQTRNGLMELDLDNGGTLALNHAFNGAVDAMAFVNGVLYLGGAFTQVDGAAHPYAVAIDMTTDTVLTWPQVADAPDSDVLAIAQGVNSNILLGGKFTVPQQHAAAIVEVGQPTAGQDSGWAPNVNGDVDAVVSTGAFYYLGGTFTNAGGAARNNIAALGSTTALADANWNPNANAGVLALATTPAGATPAEIYAGGDFATIGGAARLRIAQLAPAGGASTGAASSWNPSADGTVRAIALVQSGLVYAGGDFSNIGTKVRSSVAALDPTTGVANNWDAGLCCRVTALGSFQFDERIYLGGPFTSTKWSPVAGLAVYSEAMTVRSGVLTVDDPVAGSASNCNDPLWTGSGPYSQVTDWDLDGVPIPGAFGFFRWTPRDADAGHQLSCTVILNNLGHTSSFTSAPKTVAARPVTSGGGGGGGGAPPPLPLATPPAGPSGPSVPPGDIDGQLTPPPPQTAKTVIAEPVTGTVSVRLPGAKSDIPLPDAERIPVKTIIDARKGTVTLTAVGADGKLQTAKFFGGVFQVLQASGATPIVDLKLTRGNFTVCPKIAKTVKRAARGAKKKVGKTKSIRHLWGEGKGLFRTSGRYASATIRGTTWLVDDRCDGTLVRVTHGAVTVRDVPRRKVFALKAPKKYLARP